MSDSSRYFEIRLTPVAARERVWRYLTGYLQRFFPPDASIVDVGAGYCDFINNAVAVEKHAIDLYPELKTYAASDVQVHIGDAAEQLPLIPAGTVDLVFASNFLEHLDRDQIRVFLSAVHQTLRPGGRLMLLQPNFRKCARTYFDDYTHVSVHSDRSLPDLLMSEGFEIVTVDPRIMPMTLKSQGSRLWFLVPLYLRLPWRPFARQMLVVAAKPVHIEG
jgi:SAM-dependent methyltransferase